MTKEEFESLKVGHMVSYLDEFGGLVGYLTEDKTGRWAFRIILMGGESTTFMPAIGRTNYSVWTKIT